MRVIVSRRVPVTSPSYDQLHNYICASKLVAIFMPLSSCSPNFSPITVTSLHPFVLAVLELQLMPRPTDHEPSSRACTVLRPQHHFLTATWENVFQRRLLPELADISQPDACVSQL